MRSERTDPTTAAGTTLAVVVGVEENLFEVGNLPQAARSRTATASHVSVERWMTAP
jgi:hypothetical protein